MPNGLVFPLAFGMLTLLAGCGVQSFVSSISVTSSVLKLPVRAILLIVCPNVVGGFSPPSESGELYQSRGVFPVGLQSLGQGLV